MMVLAFCHKWSGVILGICWVFTGACSQKRDLFAEQVVVAKEKKCTVVVAIKI